MSKQQVRDSEDAREQRMKVELRKGIQCYFDVDGITIKVWGSAWSGRELVYLNDQVVSDKRSYRLSTPHEFEHAGVHYKVELGTESILRGQYSIVLLRNGERIDSDVASYELFATQNPAKPFSWWREIAKIFSWFVLGAIAGASGMLTYHGIQALLGGQ
ncbi:MAG TPA: hypothetical protein VIC08_15330 [Cellvibrionaceae bacterium]